MNIARQSFGEEIGYMTHDPINLSQEKPETEMGVPRKDLWRTLRITVGTPNIRRRPAWFLRMLYHQIYHQLGLNQTETGQNEGRLLGFYMQEMGCPVRGSTSEG